MFANRQCFHTLSHTIKRTTISQKSVGRVKMEQGLRNEAKKRGANRWPVEKAGSVCTPRAGVKAVHAGQAPVVDPVV